MSKKRMRTILYINISYCIIYSSSEEKFVRKNSSLSTDTLTTRVRAMVSAIRTKESDRGCWTSFLFSHHVGLSCAEFSGSAHNRH